MDVNKSQSLLYMYDTLIKHGFFIKEEIIRELSISTLTFYRYVQELRAYFSNFDTGFQLLFLQNENKYRLIKVNS